jgi:hypothetical protein
MNENNIKYITFDEAMEALKRGETISADRLNLFKMDKITKKIVIYAKSATTQFFRGAQVGSHADIEKFVKSINSKWDKDKQYYIMSEPSEGMPFEEALPLLKQGKAIARPVNVIYFKIDNGISCEFNKKTNNRTKEDFANCFTSGDVLATDWEEWKPQTEEQVINNALQKQLDIAVKALNTIYDNRKTWKEEELHHFIINTLNIIEGRLSDDDEE